MRTWLTVFRVNSLVCCKYGRVKVVATGKKNCRFSLSVLLTMRCYQEKLDIEILITFFFQAVEISIFLLINQLQFRIKRATNMISEKKNKEQQARKNKSNLLSLVSANVCKVSRRKVTYPRKEKNGKETYTIKRKYITSILQNCKQRRKVRKSACFLTLLFNWKLPS